MGALPVTSRETLSCLNETAGEWDLGPPPAAAPDGAPRHVYGDPERAAAWVDAVVAAATADEGWLAARRAAMVEAVRARSRWEEVADEWGVMLRRHHREGNASACGAPVEQVVRRRDPSERGKDEAAREAARGAGEL